MSHKRYILIVLSFVLCVGLCKLPVAAQNYFQATIEQNESQNVVISITPGEEVEWAGFDIYRADTIDGEYQYLGTVETNSDYNYDYDVDDDYYDWYYDWYYDDPVLTYTDTTPLNVYQTYYYRVEGFQFSEETKTVVDTAELSIFIKAAAPVITYGKRISKTSLRVKWTKDENVDGYIIYYLKNYDKKSNPISVNIDDLSSYKVAKTIKKNTTASNKFNELMNGVTYTYRVVSYKMTNGERVESVMSAPVSITMDYYSYHGEDSLQKTKRAFGSEKKKQKNFKTASKAAKQMKNIKIKVWDFKNGKSGKKVTRTKWITVNKRLAPSIKAMFDEIYKCKEKQVIKDIGCYSYRSGEHMYGMAIDINPNENYMIDGDTIMSGSFWNPKKSKYSIPLECETVRIMARYGFYRGFWGDRKDYMHFSYFGT